MNLNDFKSSFTNLARTNLFKVTVIFPNGPDMQRRIQFRCSASSVPSDKVGDIKVPWMGRQIKIAGDRIYEPWNTKILADEDWKLYKEIYEWRSSISAITSITTANDDQSYKSTAFVEALGRDGTVKQAWRLTGLWPEDLQSFELNWSTNDQVLEFDVSWSFDWFEVVPAGVLG